MKTLRYVLAAVAAGVLLAGSGCAPVSGEPAPGWGPGMMGRYGPGYGPGGGYGPGIMGGGYGPGMMGGWGGGYGPGMMGGWGGGPGWGALPADLSAEQRTRIGEIQRDLRARQWPLMQQMHALMWGDGTPGSGAFDEQAARRSYDQVAALRKQMFDNMLDARRRIDEVLTPQQRESLRGRGPAR